ncbi:hypothetical protein M9Y10_012410 [Tritrichomonas musculus]|uniref:Trafficking protein particle complex subunit n=1 Tax=Tritrichomonas musculus TaxID=1915356 RepID=A0ABR2IES4_9EUKA
MENQNTASGSFSYLLLSEAVRLFEAKYSKHLDKDALIKKKMERLGIKPGFTITAQILRSDTDGNDVEELRYVANFLIQRLAPQIFNSPKLEGRHKVTKGPTRLNLTLKIYQYSLSSFFQILIGGIFPPKDSNSRIEFLKSQNFSTSSSSPELNKTITKRKSTTSITKKIDPAIEQENERLKFWQNSIAAFFGGAFEGSLIHFGYNTELTEIKVDKETIIFVYSILHMESPYELPSQFL